MWLYFQIRSNRTAIEDADFGFHADDSGRLQLAKGHERTNAAKKNSAPFGHWTLDMAAAATAAWDRQTQTDAHFFTTLHLQICEAAAEQLARSLARSLAS